MPVAAVGIAAEAPLFSTVVPEEVPITPAITVSKQMTPEACCLDVGLELKVEAIGRDMVSGEPDRVPEASA